MLFRSENMTVDIPFIADLPEEVYKYAKAIKCNNTTEIDCKLVANRIITNYSTPRSPKNTDLLFYLYSDEYCYRLLHITYADVRSYSCLNLGGIASKRISSSIEFVNKGMSTQVELKPSNEYMLDIHEAFKTIIDTPSGSKITVPITLGSSKSGKGVVLLHCIGKLYYV